MKTATDYMVEMEDFKALVEEMGFSCWIDEDEMNATGIGYLADGRCFEIDYDGSNFIFTRPNGKTTENIETV